MTQTSIWYERYGNRLFSASVSDVRELVNKYTHGHVHYVSSGFSTGQHGSYAGSSRVVCVHVDGHIWETVPQSADQELAGLGLQQAGHVLARDA